MQVEQAAGRRDEDVDAVRQRLDLVALADAAEDDGRLQAHVLAIGREALVIWSASSRVGARIRARAPLGPAPPCLAGEALQDRQRESRRLAGAGLGEAHHVAALQKRRDGLAWMGVGML